MRARDQLANALLTVGADVHAAEHVLSALREWLLWRAEELRAEGRYGDAAWFARVANEMVS